MKCSSNATIDAPVDTIDLGAWIFDLTDDEYQRCASGHRAMGVVGAHARTGLVNVESIGSALLIQHYETQFARKDHVKFVSDASRAYLMHLLPVTISVIWEMQVSEASAGKSDFRCMIDVVMPLPVRMLAPLIGTNYFIERHLLEETKTFADDIGRKAVGESVAESRLGGWQQAKRDFSRMPILAHRQ